MNTPDENDELTPRYEDNDINQHILNLKKRHFTPIQKGALIVLAVILLIGIVIFIASMSLPGQALYGMKTGVIEEFTEALQITSSNKAAYQVERLEERMEELKEMSEEEYHSEDAIAALTNATAEHTATLAGIVDESIDSAFPKADVLHVLNEYASIAGAMEAISENDPAFAAFGEHMEDIRRDMVNLYEDRVLSFTQTEDAATVYAFMQNKLTQVKEELGSADLSEETIDDAENYLERVGPAIASNDLERAITAMAEAYRFIKLEKYGGVIEPEASQNEGAEATSTRATTSLQGTSSPVSQ